MAKLERRDFLKLASGASLAITAGALSVPMFTRSGSTPGSTPGNASSASSWPDLNALAVGKIDYTTAKAIPTICFECTTHCGVIGWVQDGRVRKIEGNPLDPNTQGRSCSKANGMISYTYYPERLLYPLKRVGKRGAGKWKRISWDEALDEIAARMRPLREQGTPEQFVFHYGRAEERPTPEASDGMAQQTDLPFDREVPGNVWWTKQRGGPGGGVHLNDALPINPCPLVGGQNWYDNVCQIRKV